MVQIRITDGKDELWVGSRLSLNAVIPLLRQFRLWRQQQHTDAYWGDVGVACDVEQATGWLILLGIRLMKADINHLSPKDGAPPMWLMPSTYQFDPKICEVDLAQSTLKYYLPDRVINDTGQSIRSIVRQWGKNG